MGSFGLRPQDDALFVILSVSEESLTYWAWDPSGFALRMTRKRVGMGSFTSFRMTRNGASF